MKKISQLKIGECLKMLDMIILCVLENTYLYIREGCTIKRTQTIPADFELETASYEELEEILDLVDHKDDWYSVLNADLVTTEFLLKELKPIF